jgi:hypothetical protein
MNRNLIAKGTKSTKIEYRDDRIPSAVLSLGSFNCARDPRLWISKLGFRALVVFESYGQVKIKSSAGLFLVAQRLESLCSREGEYERYGMSEMRYRDS